MNKIKKLIKELCPNGVEWKKLGEIGTFVRGNGLQKTDFTEKGVGCIHYGQIYTYYNLFTDKTKSFVSSDLAEKLKKVETGDIVLACTSENIEDVCKCVVWEGSETIVTGGHASIFKHNQNPRYIAYFFQSNLFVVQKVKYVYGAKVIDIKNDDLSKILIPLPPLPIQTEIVRILDKFVEQQEQLERLIELRKKQYEYYREEMMTPKEGEVEIPFSDCCTLVTKQTGFDYSSKIKPALKKQYEEGCIPFLQTRNFTNNVFDYNTEYYVPEEIVKQFPKIVLDEKCLLFSIVGASIGNVGLFPGDKKCFLGGAICVAKIKKDYDVSYLYYFMASSQGQLQIMQKTKGAGQATITIEDIRNFTVRIPSKEKMSSIVNALVALENSINALTSALEASKKRYEYYRDEMMRF